MKKSTKVALESLRHGKNWNDFLLEVYHESRSKRGEESLSKLSKLLSDADTLIAATAHSKKERLVTLDKGFQRFRPAVEIEVVSFY